ncbi:MAG: helix-turn-helix transcriptional regulator [Coriobacteriales bacterium]|jgi:proteasome accessory factor B
MPQAPTADTRRVAKCTRLANLLLFLGARPNGATAADIRAGVGGYAEAGQSDDAFERQLRRDRSDLARMGFPVDKTREAKDDPSRYSLANPPSEREGAPLDAKDRSLLRLCAQSALDDPSFPLRGELARALDKLHVKAAADEGDRQGEAGPGDTPDGGVAEAFADAIRSGGALSFAYEGASAAPSRRSVVPLKLFSYLGALYVHAYDIDKRACRKFRISRVAGDPETIAADPGVLVEARSHANDRLAVLPFQMGDERLEAALRLDASIEERIAALTDGSGDLSATDGGWRWSVPIADADRLARWVVENGPGIDIIEPREARDLLAEGLRAAARAGE